MSTVSNHGSAHGLARGLGRFSIGVGLLEATAPKRLGRVLGMEESSGLLQAYGLREIATGIGILTAHDPTGWIWAGSPVMRSTLRALPRG